MPLNAAALPQAQIDMIRSWIVAGAPPPTGASPTPSDTATSTATATSVPSATASPTSTTALVSPTVTTLATVTATVAQRTPTPSPSATATASSTSEPTVTLAQIQATVFTPICATMFCHSAATHLANLVLEDGQSFASLVNVAPDNQTARNDGLLRVRPGDPDHSLLVIKVEGPPPGSDLGSQMPFTGQPLDATQKQLIRDWVAQGALP